MFDKDQTPTSKNYELFTKITHTCIHTVANTDNSALYATISETREIYKNTTDVDAEPQKFMHKNNN